jgi:N-acyl-D-aspartate/D-glutamate deacylase
MRRRAHAALEAGAFGVSSGLIYAPGMYADTDELIEIAEVVARFDAVFACHLRGSSELLLPATDELLTIGRTAGCRVHHSHSEAVGRAHWWKVDAVLERESRARRAGIRVGHDLFPYHAAATMLAALFPPSALAGGIAALLDRLRSPRGREAVRTEIEETGPEWPPWRPGGWPHNLVRAVGWDSIRIASVPGAAGGSVGLDLAALARRQKATPFDALCDLMLEHRGEAGQLLFGISGDEQDDSPLRTLLTDPHGAICTDAEDLGRGAPHPAAYGAFSRVLGYWSRERGALTMSEAVRRMTSLPAEAFGIKGRGRLAPNFHADCVVFDPAAIGDRATYAAPRMAPAGIHHVLVGGEPVVDAGVVTAARPGRVLRRGEPA